MFRLFRYFRKIDWLFVALAIGLIVVQVWLELTMPDYTKELTTIVQTESNDMGGVWRNGGLMLACAFGSMVSAIACSFLIASVAANFSRNLRTRLFATISSFSNKEIHQFHTASLITRTTNDVVQMQNFIAMGLHMLVKAVIMAVWALAKISASEISWTVATAICIGAIVVCVIIVVATCLPKFRKIQSLIDSLNAAARENITGVRVIRAFNAQEYQDAKYEKVNDEITRTNLFTMRITSSLNPLLTMAVNGLILAIYWIGAVLINNIEFNPLSPDAQTQALSRVMVISNMAAFSQYALQVVMSFMMLIVIFIILPRTLVSGKRIYEVLQTKPSIVDGPGSMGTTERGTIEFQNVSFSYGGEGHEVVKNINFRIEKGETVAFIGATGCGKTTLINLMMRYYDVTSGRILVNGEDIHNLKLEELRANFSYAPQKAALFKGTIKSNIAYGQEEVDEEKLAKAMKIAQCGFVDGLESGVDSEVAQGGTNYSGGQKQRLSIARAVYKDADIFVFDDTFSALDYRTDMLVRKGIKENLADKTVLIVAQRIGTIKNADKIIVLDDGEIVGVGSHKELLEGNAVYQEIAHSQLDKEEL